MKRNTRDIWKTIQEAAQVFAVTGMLVFWKSSFLGVVGCALATIVLAIIGRWLTFHPVDGPASRFIIHKKFGITVIEERTGEIENKERP